MSVTNAEGEGLRRTKMSLSANGFRWVTEHASGGIGSRARTVDIAARQAKARNLTPSRPDKIFESLNLMLPESLFVIFGSNESIRDHVEATVANTPSLKVEKRVEPRFNPLRAEGYDFLQTQIDPLDDDELCRRAIVGGITAETARRKHYAEVQNQMERFLAGFATRPYVVDVWKPEKQNSRIDHQCGQLRLQRITVEEVFSKLILRQGKP